MQATAELKSQGKAFCTSTEPFTAEEARALFDETARQYMDMSGEEFLRLWDNSGPNLGPWAMRVAMLIPLIRKTGARQKSR